MLTILYTAHWIFDHKKRAKRCTDRSAHSKTRYKPTSRVLAAFLPYLGKRWENRLAQQAPTCTIGPSCPMQRPVETARISPVTLTTSVEGTRKSRITNPPRIVFTSGIPLPMLGKNNLLKLAWLLSIYKICYQYIKSCMSKSPRSALTIDKSQLTTSEFRTREFVPIKWWFRCEYKDEWIQVDRFRLCNEHLTSKLGSTTVNWAKRQQLAPIAIRRQHENGMNLISAVFLRLKSRSPGFYKCFISTLTNSIPSWMLLIRRFH